MATAGATRETITLKGSTAIVTEFFGYAVDSILYQRGIYPEENFTRVKKYGLSMLVCTDERVRDYLKQVLSQISEWLLTGKLQKLVLVVASVATKEVLERWAFNIETDKESVQTGTTREKSDKEIMSEIQAIVRQITASITFLPLLDETCTFDLLAYTAADSAVPSTWEESDARLINKSAEVKLRSFSTKVHQVDAMVAYKNDDEGD
ncbi:Spindle assembly checkpoint protein [Klebsormidium nitens]|uniref:Spindle assembly checkpoint protein n=1 Tax=Klebsormidium nitens TaxID=105231 RepID=A0A1Y1HKS8_KLENI|nr:Spindle assembly checkpoint protein [Klebsormidium nitens]|eukprot:GAQ79210.1 Spindle assembly checkpoint protein [Klebsormidium nitens]